MSRKSLYELYKRGLISKEEYERAVSIDKVYRNYAIKENITEKNSKRNEEKTYYTFTNA